MFSEVTTQSEKSKVFSVSEISNLIKSTLEDGFSYVGIKGEISGLKIHTSGHVYFNLKDANAVINAVCFKGSFSKLNIKLEEGMEVEAYGKVTTYPQRSNYQILVTHITPAGIGSLLQLLEKRKQKLADEGLFKAERKRPIPFMPKTIGVITSPTGAVIRDILHRISDRCPLNVILWPTAVQGADAAKSIVEAINGFNNPNFPYTKPDVLILARGGGSIEDLWCFNEEEVVRAVASSQIPIITAVGHETDTTLVDYASDKRAPTPTAAAEMATPLISELKTGLASKEDRLRNSLRKYYETKQLRLAYVSDSLDKIEQIITQKRMLLDKAASKLPALLNRCIGAQEARFLKVAGRLNIRVLAQRYERISDRLIAYSDRFIKSGSKLLDEKSARLNNVSSLLESYAYTNTLKRGFSIIKDEQNQIVRNKKNLAASKAITIDFYEEHVTISGFSTD